MSKRPTARQAANEPYWFAKDQEVSKAVTPMTDPEYTVEFDGKETYVICNGVKLAIRRDDRWVSIEPGVTVRDIVENGRHGIEVEFRRGRAPQRPCPSFANSAIRKWKSLTVPATKVASIAHRTESSR